jgi:hypothetical protein
MHVLARTLGASLLAAVTVAPAMAADLPTAPVCHAPRAGLIARTDLAALFAAPSGEAALEAQLLELLRRDPAGAPLLGAAADRAGAAQRAAFDRARLRAALLDASCSSPCRTPEPGLIRRSDVPALLARHPDGGSDLAALLTDLVQRDPADAAMIESAAANARSGQRATIEAVLRAASRPDAARCCPAAEPGAIARADIGRLLRENPDGGAALTSAVVRLLTVDPDGAPALVRAAAPVGRGQRLALAVAFLRALEAARDCPGDGAGAIRRALAGADPSFAAVLAALGGRGLAGPTGFSFYPGAPGGMATSSGGPQLRLVSPH